MSTAPLCIDTVAMQRLESMDDVTLTSQVQAGVNQLWNLGREAQAILRNELLPALMEIKRRYANGHSINGIRSLEKYLEFVGLNPNTVRSWELRARNDEIKQLVGDIFVDTEIPEATIPFKRSEVGPAALPSNRSRVGHSHEYVGICPNKTIDAHHNGSQPECSECVKWREKRITERKEHKKSNEPSRTVELRNWFAARFDRFKMRQSEQDLQGQGGRTNRYDLVLLGLLPAQVKAIGEILNTDKKR